MFARKIELAFSTMIDVDPIISKLPASMNHITTYEVVRAYVNGAMAILTEIDFLSDYKAARRKTDDRFLDTTFGQPLTPIRVLSDFIEDMLQFGFVVRKNRIDTYGHPIGSPDAQSRVVDLVGVLCDEYITASRDDMENTSHQARLRLKRAESCFYGVRDTIHAIMEGHNGDPFKLVRSIMSRSLTTGQIAILLGERRSYDALSGSIS